jgi:hypothetical protein
MITEVIEIRRYEPDTDHFENDVVYQREETDHA